MNHEYSTAYFKEWSMFRTDKPGRDKTKAEKKNMYKKPKMKK